MLTRYRQVHCMPCNNIHAFMPSQSKKVRPACGVGRRDIVREYSSVPHPLPVRPLSFDSCSLMTINIICICARCAYYIRFSTFASYYRVRAARSHDRPTARNPNTSNGVVMMLALPALEYRSTNRYTHLTYTYVIKFSRQINVELVFFLFHYVFDPLQWSSFRKTKKTQKINNCQAGHTSQYADGHPIYLISNNNVISMCTTRHRSNIISILI